MMSLQGATIAFDLDGTLVDTVGDLIGSMNTVLAEETLSPFPVEAGRRLIGHGVSAAVQRAFAEKGVALKGAPLAGMVDRFTEIYRGRIAQESRAFEGVPEALDRLAAAGARLAICTNKRTALSMALLDALDLTSRFAFVAGGDLVAQKPDPRLLHYAIQQAGGTPDRALFVGDSMVDQATARAAGVPVVGVTFGYVPTPLRAEDFDALINSFTELPPVAERLLQRTL
jgi:phosphoglycolate phosphatase